MDILGTSISCGVRRLAIANHEHPTSKRLNELLAGSSCAIIIAAVPTYRKDLTSFLLENKFEQVKNPNIFETHKEVEDKSVKTAFKEMAFIITHHDHEEDMIDDAAIRFKHFTGSTINDNLTELASLVMHHGNELVGNLSLFIYYTNK